MDPELRAAMDELVAAYPPASRWVDSAFAQKLYDQLEGAVDDEALNELLVALTAYVEARKRRQKTLAAFVRLLTTIAEFAEVFFR